MNVVLKLFLGLLKMGWKLIKMALFVVDTAFKVTEQSERNIIPVCGVLEAYSRREREEISREDFIEVTRIR